MARSGHKSISRVDYKKKNAHGWLVRIAFRGENHQKFFSDANFGNKKREALKAAIQWRNKIEKQIGKPRTDRKVATTATRNTTGVTGVRLTTKAMTRDGRKQGQVYEVWWFPKPGVIRKTSFSIYKYGRQEAFRRAVALRKSGEKEMYGSLVSPSKSKGKK